MLRSSSRKRSRNESDPVERVPVKEQLHSYLDEYCNSHGLVELHSHLMGMGSADFWVSRIIEQYIPRSIRNGGKDVFYPLEDIMTASSITKPKTDDAEWNTSIMLATLESRLFDGIPGGNFAQYCKKDKNLRNEEVYGIYNNDLVKLLNMEEANRNGRPLRALVRNWFEFLDSEGKAASHTDILDAYRGKFDPEFYPRRFIMKDVILNTHPEVLSILLNSVTHRYGKAGVGYMELSVSLGDLTKSNTLACLLDHVYTTKRSASLQRKSRKSKPPLPPVAQQPTRSRTNSASSDEVSTDGTDLPEDLPLTESTSAAFHMPHLPKIMLHGRMAPTWRTHMNYYQKSTHQVYYFLGALNRNGAAQLPMDVKDTVVTYAALTHEHCTTAAYQRLHHLGVNSLLSDISSSTREGICARFAGIAERLCDDDVIEHIFLSGTNNSYRRKLQCMEEQISTLVAIMVGLDWVGNELGYPYCIYAHDQCINVIKQYQLMNSRFGVRIHAGEGLLRPATSDDYRSPVSIAFTLHMYILMASIRRYYSKMEAALNGTGLKPNIRIGHGIAFLHGHDVADEVKDPLQKDLAKFRTFLKEKDIVCELNPTSNHLLLSDSYTKTTLSNNRTLAAFLKEGLPVTLCTDDDGIWAIHKCPKHYHHISVAYEYCQAIEHGDITTIKDLKDMLDAGRTYAFALQ